MNPNLNALDRFHAFFQDGWFMTRYAIYKSIFFYNFFAILNRLLKNFLISKIFSFKFKNRIAHLYLRFGYERYFFKLDLKRAYKFRIQHCIMETSQNLSSTIAFSENYLRTINDEATLDWIGVNNQERLFISKFNFNQISFSNGDECFDQNKSILIAGPKYNFDINSNLGCDYLIINKPPPDNIIEGFNGKILVICSPEWARRKVDLIESYKAKFKNILFLSSKDFPHTHKSNACIEYPLYPYGSCLMNLQRTLLASKSLFVDSKFIVEGYDFAIWADLHDHWYHKLALNTGQNPLASLGRHDWLMSLIFTKQFFINNNNFSGSTVDIFKMPLDEIIGYFQATYRKYKL